ncbi:MAG: homoserine kinase [Flavobacteriales bacterium]|nr:homoserine kinase [Flavobacteriales bacterium]|tara:strand:+ start:27145 stop:28071 length:927 start_codon:yes stop_codon:yes gene_type:complete
MNQLKVFAPATVANVACGFDVLGLALDYPGDEALVTKTNKNDIVITACHNAENLPLAADKNVAGVAVKALLDKLGSDQGFEIELTKGVKPGSGIGSSAASSAAAVVAVNELLGTPFTKKELVKFAMEGERCATGVAHADNVAPSICGGFTLVRSYEPLDIIKIDSPKELWATVIHPQLEVKTRDARRVLKGGIDLSKAITQWGNVGGLVAGLYSEDYDLIGRSLVDVVIEPIRSILIPGYEKVKRATIEAGALGCSISGSGPSIFGLSKGEETANKVKAAMGDVYTQYGVDFEIHVSQVNSEGAKVIG